MSVAVSAASAASSASSGDSGRGAAAGTAFTSVRAGPSMFFEHYIAWLRHSAGDDARHQRKRMCVKRCGRVFVVDLALVALAWAGVAATGACGPGPGGWPGLCAGMLAATRAGMLVPGWCGHAGAPCGRELLA